MVHESRADSGCIFMSFYSDIQRFFFLNKKFSVSGPRHFPDKFCQQRPALALLRPSCVVQATIAKAKLACAITGARKN